MEVGGYPLDCKVFAIRGGKKTPDCSQFDGLPLLDENVFGYTTDAGCASDAQAVPHIRYLAAPNSTAHASLEFPNEENRSHCSPF